MNGDISCGLKDGSLFKFCQNYNIKREITDAFPLLQLFVLLRKTIGKSRGFTTFGRFCKAYYIEMENKLSFRIASFLYNYSFPLYNILYKNFKLRQDAHEIELVKELVHEGDIVLDIGSNIGFYSAIISDVVGEKGKVHCFEPDRKNFAHLEDKLGKRPNVVLNNKAVSEKTGKLEIFTSHRLNVDHRMYRPEKYDTSYLVDTISVDDYLSNSRHVDFIKMDIQGAEMFALKGMQKTISENKSLKILTEFWPHGLESAGSSPAEVLTFMNGFGYSGYLIVGKKTQPLSADQLSTLGKTENDFYNVIFRR